MIQLRPIVADDLYLLFNWRNLPDIVAVSTNQRQVTRDEHQAWFERIFMEKDMHLPLIIVDFSRGRCRDIGHIRFTNVRNNQDWRSIIWFCRGSIGWIFTASDNKD